MKPGYILKTDADFDNALMFGWRIEVWQDGELIDYGGPIEAHTNDAVKINGAYFLKATCEFRIR
mgnify:CR=1 FL=1